MEGLLLPLSTTETLAEALHVPHSKVGVAGHGLQAAGTLLAVTVALASTEPALVVGEEMTCTWKETPVGDPARG